MRRGVLKRLADYLGQDRRGRERSAAFPPNRYVRRVLGAGSEPVETEADQLCGLLKQAGSKPVVRSALQGAAQEHVVVHSGGPIRPEQMEHLQQVRYGRPSVYPGTNDLIHETEAEALARGAALRAPPPAAVSLTPDDWRTPPAMEPPYTRTSDPVYGMSDALMLLRDTGSYVENARELLNILSRHGYVLIRKEHT